jgi:hypothetical protein
MSTTFDVLATQASTMNRVYDDLWNYSVYAAGVVSQTYGSQSANQLNAIKSYQTAIGKLPALRDRVLSGTYAFSSWASYAKELRASIAYTLGDVSNWSWTGILDATYEQTVEDVQEVAGTALKFGAAGLGVFAIGAVALALVIYGPRR